MSDCLPYLKCFNVEDVVNIRGHFSFQDYLCDTAVNKRQVTKEKQSKKKKKKINHKKRNQQEADGCSQDWENVLVLDVKKYFYQLFFVSVIQQNGQIAGTYVNTTGFPQTLIIQSLTEQEYSRLAVKTQ